MMKRFYETGKYVCSFVSFLDSEVDILIPRENKESV